MGGLLECCVDGSWTENLAGDFCVPRNVLANQKTCLIPAYTHPCFFLLAFPILSFFSSVISLNESEFLFLCELQENRL